MVSASLEIVAPMCDPLGQVLLNVGAVSCRRVVILGHATSSDAGVSIGSVPCHMGPIMVIMTHYNRAVRGILFFCRVFGFGVALRHNSIHMRLEW